MWIRVLLEVPDDLRGFVEVKSRELEPNTRYHTIVTEVYCKECGELLGEEHYYFRQADFESRIKRCEHFKWIERPERDYVLILTRRT